MTPERMAQIHAACFDGAPRPWTADECREYLNGDALVLSEDDDAFAVLRIVGDEAELLTIAVDPAAQRQGLGRGLMEKLTIAAGNAGCASIVLEVAETNDAARGLYRAQGFEDAGFRKNYYAARGKVRTSALVLRKIL